MLFTNPYEAFDGDNRCLYHTQFTVAGQKGEFAQQKGYGAGDLRRQQQQQHAAEFVGVFVMTEYDDSI